MGIRSPEQSQLTRIVPYGIGRSARVSWVEVIRRWGNDGARPCSFEDNSVDLLHNYRLHIWLKEIQFDALLLIVALALFVLLAR